MTKPSTRTPEPTLPKTPGKAPVEPAKRSIDGAVVESPPGGVPNTQLPATHTDTTAR